MQGIIVPPMNEQYVTLTMFNKTMEDVYSILHFIMDNMATKDDIAELRSEVSGMATKEDIKNMATKQDLRDFRTEFKEDLQHLEEKFLYRYENRFERAEDNILQIKTKLSMR